MAFFPSAPLNVGPRGQRADIYWRVNTHCRSRDSTWTAIRNLREHLGWVPEECRFWRVMGRDTLGYSHEQMHNYPTLKHLGGSEYVKSLVHKPRSRCHGRHPGRVGLLPQTEAKCDRVQWSSWGSMPWATRSVFKLRVLMEITLCDNYRFKQV